MTLPARSSNQGYDCARRRTTTTPRVTRENRPATTGNYKTISGRGAAEVAEYGSDPGGDPTDRHRRGWLASPDERKLQNNFDTGAGESRGDGVETTAPLTASGWAGAGLSVTQPTDTDGDGWQVPTNENYKTISIRAPAL